MPAPETFDGNPEKLRDWLFQVTLYFNACCLDYEDSYAEYFGSLMASMLRGNALLWLRWYTVSTPQNQLATKYADLKALLEKQFAVIDEARNAHDKLKTLVQTKNVSAYMQAFEAVALQSSMRWKMNCCSRSYGVSRTASRVKYACINQKRLLRLQKLL